MMRSSMIWLTAWMALFACGSVITLFAQTSEAGDSTRARVVHIKSADVLVVDEVDGQRVNRLSGSVVLTQEGAILYAERAVQYPQSDLIVFDGGVQIVDEGDTLRADRIEYQTEIRLAQAAGAVSWTDGEVELTSRTGEYRLDDKVATFSGDVKMRDSLTTIFSETGEYRVEEELAVFSHSVFLRQEKLDLLADSVTHDRKTGLTLAVGSVRIYQTDRDNSDSKVVLIGGRAESRQETGASLLWGDPRMVRVSATNTGADTLIVSANQLQVSGSGSAQSFRANGDAKMWQNELSGLADSLYYMDSSETDSATIIMTGSPILWSGDAQVSGDTIAVQFHGGNPVNLTSSPNAFVAFEDTALGRIQQIRGNGLVATFRDDSLKSLVVQPQAEALYFGEESTGDRESVVQFSSSSITLHFDAGEIGRIVAATDVEGDIKEFEKGQPPTLEGFEWRGGARPGRQTMITRELLEALQHQGTALN